MDAFHGGGGGAGKSIQVCTYVHVLFKEHVHSSSFHIHLTDQQVCFYGFSEAFWTREQSEEMKPDPVQVFCSCSVPEICLTVPS